MDVAANYLTAELDARQQGRFRAALSWLWAAGEIVFSLGDGAAPLDLVVRRRETGAEVMRTPADVGSPEILLAQVEEDMLSKTVDEFLSEWRKD